MFARALQDPSVAGMGTTATVALVDEEAGTIAIAHVGDSRAYRYREGVLEQLTSDHSLVGELVRSGRLTEDEAAVHPHRSVITRALGTEPEVEVDTTTVDALPGDLLLLCSDGLSAMVRDDGHRRASSSARPAIPGSRRRGARPRRERRRRRRQRHRRPLRAGRGRSRAARSPPSRPSRTSRARATLELERTEEDVGKPRRGQGEPLARPAARSRPAGRDGRDPLVELIRERRSLRLAVGTARAPVFLRARGTSPFTTPLPAHGTKGVP